jgi:hypothetical protein
MINSADADGTHPLERIAIALERIADSLIISKDPFRYKDAIADQCLPKEHKTKYDVIA